MVIEMLTDGDLTISALFNIDKLFASTTAAGSNIVIKDGGSVSIRNGTSAVSHGSITVLDGGAFDCKSGIYFIWGRWDNDSCFFNLHGGTANFTSFAPWRNGYINDALITLKGGGVGTFASAANITDWSGAGKLVPAKGSLLTYDAVNSPTTLSSIDLNLPEAIDTTVSVEDYILPDFVSLYATGDTANTGSITVVQTPTAGTSYSEDQEVEVIVNANDALGNSITDTLTVTIGDVVTQLNQSKNVAVNIYSTLNSLRISTDEYSTYTVYALSGKVINQGAISNGSTDLQLNEGIYITKVSNSSGIHTEKVIVR